MAGLIEQLTNIYNITTFAETKSKSPPNLEDFEKSTTLNPIQYDKSSLFASSGNSEDGEWWQVTLINISIKFSAFRVKTYDHDKNEAHMKIYEFHAGNSEDSLNLIYHEDNATYLNEPYGEKTINLQQIYGPYNVFRITSLQTHRGPTTNYAHVLRLEEFDVYGSIKGPISYIIRTYLKNTCFPFYLLYILLCPK